MTHKPKHDKTGYRPDRCQATTRTGHQCGNRPITGLTVCYRHGGATQRARRAGQRNHAQQQLKEQLSRHLGEPPDNIDYVTEQTRLIATKTAEVQWLRHQIDAIHDSSELFFGTTKTIEKTTPFGDTHEEVKEARLNIIYTTLHRAQDQLNRYITDALRAGIEERRVALEESFATQLVDFAIILGQKFGIPADDHFYLTIEQTFAELSDTTRNP